MAPPRNIADLAMMHEAVSNMQRNSRTDAEGARIARPDWIS